MNNQLQIPAQQQAIIGKCYHPTGQWIEFPRECLEQSIVTRFEEIVEQYPNRLALKDEKSQLSYTDLNESSNRIAHAILDSLDSPDVPIALLFEQGIRAITAIMGIAKAGCCYVPLDPDYPIERVSYMLRDSQAKLIVSDDVHVELARQLSAGEIPILNIDQLSPNLSIDNPEIAISPQQLLYIMYTSGSTGQPKGVMETHRNVLHHVLRVTNNLHICNEDKQTLIRSHCYNGSVKDIFGSLLNGASTHSLNLKKNGLDRLAQWLVEDGITIFRSVITVYRNLANTLDQPNMFPDLRVITCGGMSATQRDIRLYQRHLSPNCLFVPEFGITETSVVCMYYYDHTSDCDSPIAPIGYPLDDIEFLLLNHEHQPVPQGEVGEIAIRIPYLSPGYWQRPDISQTKFSTDPDDYSKRIYFTGDLGRQQADGSFVHLGRNDFQVKIRGFRVELSEIETALLNLDQVQDALVIGQDNEQDNKHGSDQLIAYIVPAAKKPLTVSHIRRRLAQSLPDYMIPAHFLFLDALPLNINNKVDRSALPLPNRARPLLDTPLAPPSTPLQESIAQIWEQILGLEKIGIHDDFFELGGDSIRGMMVLNILQKELKQTLYPTILFDAPTIAAFAAHLNRHYPQAVDQTDNAASNAILYQPIDQQKVIQFRQTVLRPWVSEPAEIKDAPKNGPALFILAAPRSGTTLLRTILAGHAGLFSPPELDLLGFHTLDERRRTFTGRLSGRQEGVLRALMALRGCDAEEAKSIMASFEDQNMSIPEFYQTLQQWIGHRLLVDKTPSYCRRVETLQQAERWFESPYYIHLLRHPYAMIHSYEESRMDQNYAIRHDYHPRELAELIWLTTHQNATTFLADIPPARQCQIRYEDLVADPQKILRELCDFLNLEFDSEMLEIYEPNHDRMVDGLYSNSRMIGDIKFHQHNKIDPTVAERWREKYTEDFLSDLSWMLAETLGYRAEILSANNAGPLERDLLEQILADVETLEDEEVLRSLGQPTSQEGSI